MNLLDFEYLEANLDTKDLYGSDSCIANILFRYYYGDENRTGYGFPVPLKNYTDSEFLKNVLEYILFENSKNLKPAFCLITQDQKNQIDSCLAKYYPEYHVSWKTNRDDCDYIYLRENLADLPGSLYQKKRNHISRFKRIYGTNWEFKTYPENEIADDILTVADKWFIEKDGEENLALQLEKHSIRDALENAEVLKLRGGVLYINGEPAAMTLASPISDSVLDVIYEKCIEAYEKDGAYAVINQQFSKRCSQFLYLNREEDMGVEGLRKAKLSYKPAVILEKFYGQIIR